MAPTISCRSVPIGFIILSYSYDSRGDFVPNIAMDIAVSSHVTCTTNVIHSYHLPCFVYGARFQPDVQPQKGTIYQQTTETSEAFDSNNTHLHSTTDFSCLGDEELNEP